MQFQYHIPKYQVWINPVEWWTIVYHTCNSPWSSSGALKVDFLDLGVSPWELRPRLCFIFLDSLLSGDENGDLCGPPSALGRRNSWYQSGSATGSMCRDSKKSGRSVGVCSTCCLPACVTVRAKGKRHVYFKSFVLNLSSRGRRALRFFSVICDESWNSMIV